MSVDMARLPPDEIVAAYKTEHKRAFPNKPVSDFDILQFKDDFIYRRKEALVTYGADMYYKEEMIRFIETMKKIADNPEIPLHMIYAEVLAITQNLFALMMFKNCKMIMNRRGGGLLLPANISKLPI